MDLLIINGPNLNLLGRRQPHIYGTQSFEEFLEELKREFDSHNIAYFQSNHEGHLIDKIHEVGFDDTGIIFNPGGYSHTSIALCDAVAAITAPVVEVHISNIYEREEFRHHSYVALSAVHSIVGKGLNGYREAIQYLESIN